jgi:hypothetical protein
MIEVLLVFSINGAPEEISDRIFYSKQECVEFVNQVAQMDVVKDDYTFKFVASDGMLFKGECAAMKEWFLKKGRLEV